MTYKEIMEKVTTIHLEDLSDWLFLCTPDVIRQVELACYRLGLTDKANVAFCAGVANCGDDYIEG